MVPPRSPSPPTIASCSAIVAMTGCAGSASNSDDDAPSRPSIVREYSMTMHCRPRQMPSVGTRFSRAQRSAPSLPSMPADAEPAGHQHGVDALEREPGTLGRLAVVGGDPADDDLGVVVEAAGAQRLGHRQVGVGQVDVLADERDLDAVGRLVHAVQQVVPALPVDVPERQAEPLHDVGVEPLGVQHARDVVDARRVLGGDHALDVDVAHERDLALRGLGDLAVGAQHDRVRLDADAAQRGDGVLRRLRLELARRADVRHQRDVQEEARCRGRGRGAPDGPPRGTAATRCRRPCRRSP